METVSTDVLVIGGGIAGLAAAIEARKTGLEVMICSKTTPGLASCSTLAGGGFKSECPGFTADQHRQMTLMSGRELCDMALVDALAENSRKYIMVLREYGVKIRERAQGFYIPAEKRGQEGLNITKPMSAYARSSGVRFMHPFLAFGLLQENGRVSGVWGVYKKKGSEPLAIAAKSVVLATGGGGSVFLRTSNPPGTTGDGYCLAFRAGLPLVDMEFVQHYPLTQGADGKINSIVNPVLGDVGRFYNSVGESLLDKYGINRPPLATLCRDELSRALSLEVAEGKGLDGGIRFDLDDADSAWERAGSIWGYDRQYMNELREETRKLMGGCSHMLVMPAAHFFMGGVMIDAWCQTSSRGLFAAGEVTGGLHGANRVGGNALAEVCVFGHRAGQKAAEFTYREGKTCSMIHRIARNAWDEYREEYSAPGGSGIVPEELAYGVRRLLWENSGVIRSQQSLEAALHEIDRYEREVPRVRDSGVYGTAGQMEMINMIATGKMVLKSALLRKESRGGHYRSDYPLQDDGAWARHIIVRGKDKDMVAAAD